MFAESLTSYASVLVTAVVLIPMALFLAAMLFEGAGKKRWGAIRRATRKTFASPPLLLPFWRTPSIGAGGLDFRRVAAAPHQHE